MKVVIGIDVGGSTTKICGFTKEGERTLLTPQLVRADDPLTSAYGAFGKFHFVVFRQSEIVLRYHAAVDEHLLSNEQRFHVVPRRIAFAKQKFKQRIATIHLIRRRIDGRYGSFLFPFP